MFQIQPFRYQFHKFLFGKISHRNFEYRKKHDAALSNYFISSLVIMSETLLKMEKEWLLCLDNIQISGKSNVSWSKVNDGFRKSTADWMLFSIFAFMKYLMSSIKFRNKCNKIKHSEIEMLLIQCRCIAPARSESIMWNFYSRHKTLQFIMCWIHITTSV